MKTMKKIVISSLIVAWEVFALLAEPSNKPETWFHIIGGNASKEGLAADIAAVADAGISGISLFHGGGNGTALWPGVTNGIPCMSENWVELIKFAETECHRRGLKFKMQNCPGWSMSGGPWITPDRAMRKLVCFEPGKKPTFDANDDYHEIGEVEFPVEADDPSVVRSLVLPAPSHLNHKWSFEPGVVFEVWSRGKELDGDLTKGPFSRVLRSSRHYSRRAKPLARLPRRQKQICQPSRQRALAHFNNILTM